MSARVALLLFGVAAGPVFGYRSLVQVDPAATADATDATEAPPPVAVTEVQGYTATAGADYTSDTGVWENQGITSLSFNSTDIAKYGPNFEGTENTEFAEDAAGCGKLCTDNVECHAFMWRGDDPEWLAETNRTANPNSCFLKSIPDAKCTTPTDLIMYGDARVFYMKDDCTGAATPAPARRSLLDAPAPAPAADLTGYTASPGKDYTSDPGVLSKQGITVANQVMDIAKYGPEFDGTEATEFVETALECSQLCDADPKCHAFMWRGDDAAWVAITNRTESPNSCFLKQIPTANCVTPTDLIDYGDGRVLYFRDSCEDRDVAPIEAVPAAVPTADTL